MRKLASLAEPWIIRPTAVSAPGRRTLGSIVTKLCSSIHSGALHLPGREQVIWRTRTAVLVALIKFVHVASICLWAAGLVSLPGLYVQRSTVANRDALHRLQKIVRFSYVNVISPAAFIAVLSGIVLIFLRQVYAPWFSVKLLFVASLVILHVLTGLVIIRIFREGEGYPVWRFLVATIVTSGIVVTIFVIVLAKPDIDVAVADGLFKPGGLRSLIQRLSPWPIP